MKYCPNCGAEYRAGFESCSDCHVALVDEPSEVVAQHEEGPVLRERTVIFRSGRRMDAELVRGRLEADGIDARIWSSGLGPWRLESALTEVTGVASEFNAHQVVVDPHDRARALELLQEAGEDGFDVEPEPDPGSSTFLASLRKRWMLLAFAIFMLAVVIIAGPVGS